MCCGDCGISVGGDDYGPWEGGVDELALLELAGFFLAFSEGFFGAAFFGCRLWAW